MGEFGIEISISPEMENQKRENLMLGTLSARCIALYTTPI